jgi:hypothetical protein
MALSAASRTHIAMRNITGSLRKRLFVATSIPETGFNGRFGNRNQLHFVTEVLCDRAKVGAALGRVAESSEARFHKVWIASPQISLDCLK